jgi:hypothetical protein
MTALNVAMMGSAVHTGPCLAVPAALVSAARRLSLAAAARPGEPRAAYCLLDQRGRHIGLIAVPASRPVLGPHAPTVYLRRV